MKTTVFTILIIFIGTAYAQCNRFPVKVQGNQLVLNDGTERRFFFSGMVDNRPSSGEQLSRYDHQEMETQMIESTAIGCNAMRWNAFLKGLDFTWDENGYVTGLKEGSFTALRDGLDVAYENGVMVQLVLSTAHFLKYGWGGVDNVIGGIRNGDRVANNKQMLTTEAGRTAYINEVLHPIMDSIGIHPALIGYVIINEAYGMTDPQDTPNGSWSDEFARLSDLQKFASSIASEIHQKQPGALCSVSGISAIQVHYDDAALLAAGASEDGLMDIYQYQYYPENHKETYSPFQNTPADMINLWGGSVKPVIAGEFPIEGLPITDKNTVEMNPTEAYEALWNLGYSGGFTWSNLVYTNSDAPQKAAIDLGYQTFYTEHLSTLDPWGYWDANTDCKDCNGDVNGGAKIDDCGVCAGGTTEIIANSSCQINEVSYTLEAEDGDLVGVLEETAVDGYSGTGYVGSFKNEGDQVTINFDLPEAGNYEIWIRYNSPFAQKKLEIQVNNELTNEMIFPQNEGFTSLLFKTRDLTLGANSITISKLMSWVYIDYIELKKENIVTKVTASSKDVRLSIYPNPVQGEASLSRKVQWELFNSLGLLIKTGDGDKLNFEGLSEGVYFLKSKDTSLTIVKR